MKPPDPLVQSNVRMPQWAIDAYEAWAAERNAEVGYEKFTRSDLMRDELLGALKRREEAKRVPAEKRRKR